MRKRNQTQKANSHGSDDRFYLFMLGARVRGRMQSSVSFGSGSHGGDPRPLSELECIFLR